MLPNDEASLWHSLGRIEEGQRHLSERMGRMEQQTSQRMDLFENRTNRRMDLLENRVNQRRPLEKSALSGSYTRVWPSEGQFWLL